MREVKERMLYPARRKGLPGGPMMIYVKRPPTPISEK